MTDAPAPALDTSLVGLVKQSITAWMDDYAPSMGAALSYYTVFSLAPLLLLVIAVAGLVFDTDVARSQVIGQIGGLIGPEGSAAIEGLLKSASHPAQSLMASIVGIVTLMIGATSIFAELQSDLDRVWRAPAAARPVGLWGLLRTRILSLGLIVSIGFLLLVSLVVSAGLAAFGTWYGAWFPGWVITLQIVNQLVSLAFVTVLFALMYRILPSVRVTWRDVWRGAFVTGVLFTIGKFLIGLYLGKAGITSGFGAAGSLVVLLVWVFYSAQIFLLGAEFTWVYAHTLGSRRGVPPPQPAGLMREPDARHDRPPVPVRGSPPSALSRPHHAADVLLIGVFWLGVRMYQAAMRRKGSRRARTKD